MYFGYLPLVRYMIGTFFLPVSRLPFYFLELRSADFMPEFRSGPTLTEVSSAASILHFQPYLGGTSICSLFLFHRNCSTQDD